MLPSPEMYMCVREQKRKQKKLGSTIYWIIYRIKNMQKALKQALPPPIPHGLEWVWSNQTQIKCRVSVWSTPRNMIVDALAWMWRCFPWLRFYVWCYALMWHFGESNMRGSARPALRSGSLRVGDKTPVVSWQEGSLAVLSIQVSSFLAVWGCVFN